MTRKTKSALAKVIQEDCSHTEYKGFIIFKYFGARYQVRWFQEDLGLWHTWSPWCDSVEEAEHVVEKLIARSEAGE